MNRAIILLLLPLGLSACASTSDYPSLARRPAERITGSALAVPPKAPPPTPPSPVTGGRLAQLVEQTRSAHQRFTARRPAAERAVAAAGAVASDSWAAASVALAELEAARSEAMIAVAALDEIYAAESVEGSNPGDVQAAREAHDQASAWIAEEDEVLDRLRGRLRG